MRSSLLSILCTLVATGFPFVGAHTQTSPGEAHTDEIVVTGAREGTLHLKRLQRAQAIFRAGRATFAPTSTLVFQIVQHGLALPRPLTLRLRDGDKVILVALDERSRFTLPTLDGGRWELLHNEGKSAIAVRALVFSAGANEADRPLGDLRLGCRVSWELQKERYSIFARAGFDAMGGCSSARFGFFVTMPRPIASASIAVGSKLIALPLGADRAQFRAPLSDTALPNDARVRVVYP